MFSNPLDPDNAIIKRKIGEWLNFYLHDHTIIEIAELLHCQDRSCPDATTLIKIQSKDGSETHLRISKPIVYVRKWDVEELSKKVFAQK